MVTGEPLRRVVADVGHDGGQVVENSRYPDGRRGFTLCEIVRYLAGRGFILGVPLDQTVSITDPAILIVQGRKYKHAVLWTGLDVLDPNPTAPDNRQPMDYQILQWWPGVRVI